MSIPPISLEFRYPVLIVNRRKIEDHIENILDITAFYSPNSITKLMTTVTSLRYETPLLNKLAKNKRETLKPEVPKVHRLKRLPV